ncbi:MAG: REP-associated tyrosine transposase [Burkholderiales bacterium]
MSSYRRARIAGGSYFFTVTLEDRMATLLVDHVDELRRAFAATRSESPFKIDAIVVMPNHLHCVWTLPEGDSDYSARWQRIKGRFSRKIPRGEAISASRNHKRERGIWHRRYWEHLIRDDHDYETHVDYIHYNPVKHGLAGQVRDWQHSSFHRYVGAGVLPADWAGTLETRNGTGGHQFGEL